MKEKELEELIVNFLNNEKEIKKEIEKLSKSSSFSDLLNISEEDIINSNNPELYALIMNCLLLENDICLKNDRKQHSIQKKYKRTSNFKNMMLDLNGAVLDALSAEMMTTLMTVHIVGSIGLSIFLWYKKYISTDIAWAVGVGNIFLPILMFNLPYDIAELLSDKYKDELEKMKNDNERKSLNSELIDKIIEKEDCPESFMFYVSRINLYETILSEKSVNKINSFIYDLNTQNKKFKSLDDSFQNTEYGNFLLNILEEGNVTEKESTKVNLGNYNVIDVMETNNYFYPVIYPGIEFIKALERKKIDTIEFGEYPHEVCLFTKTAALNELLKLKQLKKTNKMYRMISNGGQFKAYQEYEYCGKKYVKVKGSWLEVAPVKWKVDSNMNCLVFEDMKISKKLLNQFVTPKDFKNFFSTTFRKDIVKIGEIQDKDSEFEKIVEETTAINRFKELKEKEDIHKEELFQAQEKVFEALKNIDTAISEYNKIYDNADLREMLPHLQKQTRIKGIHLSAIIEKIGNHYEIIPKFIPYLKYVDFYLCDYNIIYNLKMSGIDWSETNIRIDPQKVYKKDLSNAKFSDENLFGSFDKVNLCGSDVSNESLPISIETAIKNEKTKLPKGKKSVLMI